MGSKPVFNRREKQEKKEPVHLFANPQFWSILTIFILITLHHYDNFTSFRLFSTPDLPLGLTRHTVDRVLYLVPIVLSSLVFGSKGGRIAVMAAFLAMMPRAIFISDYEMSSLWETIVVTLVGSLAPLGLDHYKKQEKQLEVTIERLESTQRELRSKVQLTLEQQRQLAVINTFSAMLSKSMEFGKVMSATLDMIMDVMEVEVAMIFSLDENYDVLRLVAFRGIEEESGDALDKMRLGEGLCGRVAKSGQPMAIDDTKDDPAFCSSPVVEERLRTELSVPIVAHGKTMGTICIASREERRFTEPDKELLSALGRLVGIAMQNAHLSQEREFAIGQLKASENRYRQLFENAHDAIWVQNLSGRITAANQAAAELFGCDLNELLNSDSRQFFMQDDVPMVELLNEELSGEAQQQPYRRKIIKKDGTKAFVTLTTNLISDNGKPDGLQFIGRDITNEVRMQENQGFYLRRITSAHEEERQRISRDLHDSTAQNLIAALRQLEKFNEEHTQLPKEKQKFLWKLHRQLKETLQEIRQLSRDLRPSVLDNLGLLPAVEWLTEQLTTEHKIKADLNVIGKERRFSQEIEITLFRIIQEALRNIAKHSEATDAKVTLELRDDETCITITDNGKGFKLPATLGDFSRRGKLGIDGMQTRVELAGGTFSIQSALGKGTTIKVMIPA